MVRGLDIFRDHFKDYGQHYVLIGGTACMVAMEEVGIDFRATSDLDIVLCVEALDVDFVKIFWDFINNGKYQNQQKSTGRRLFYRFYDPVDTNYPKMLELFSRKPDALHYEGNGNLTPIPLDEEVSSLSAILLDDDYYSFIHARKQVVDGLSVVSPECLITLKARAWLDLTRRKDEGEDIHSNDIKKHKNDVFRLYPLLTPEHTINLPDSIKNDFRKFISKIESGEPVQLKDLMRTDDNLDNILTNLKTIYNL